jgi:hypothetical protein
MGELLDRLNAADSADAPTTSAIDQATALFHAASQKVNEAIGAVPEPGMPLGVVKSGPVYVDHELSRSLTGDL